MMLVYWWTPTFFMSSSKMHFPQLESLCVFGDPAYPLRVHLQAPFRHGILTPAMEAYNAEMSSVRVTVEWLFGDVINDFKFLDFKKNLKIGMSSVGKNVPSLCYS